MDNFKTFEENGFVTIPKDKKFAEYLANLSSEIKLLTPDYESMEVPSMEPASVPYDLRDSTILHRLNGVGELPKQMIHENPLFGKRIVIQAHDFPDKLISILDYPYILEHVESVLGTSEVVLLNGSIAASYPGSTGHDGQYHSDTANFTNAKKALRCISENKFVLNVQILLDDVDEQLAPMKMLKGTHQAKNHLAMNSLVSKRLDLPDNQENLVQMNWVYDELLEDFDLDEQYLTGERGCISLMSSSLLHRATENLTSNRVRRVAILNYVRKSDSFFERIYPYKKSKLFCSKLENKNHTVYDSYKNSARALPHILIRAKKFYLKIENFFSRNLNRIIRPYYSVMRLKRIWERSLNKLREVRREYINIGGGPVWLHERFFTLDQCFESDESLGRINFDLVKDLPMPFEDNSIKGIYSSNCFEHLTESEVTIILKDSYRILRSGGTIRITVPDMGKMFDAYEKRDASYFWFRSKQHLAGQAWFKDSWLRVITRSFAGHVVDLFEDKKLYEMYKESDRENFVKKILKASETSPSYRNIPRTHKSYWTPESLVKKLEDLGFKNCLSVKKGETRDKIFSNGLTFDNTLPDKSLFVEATK